VRQLWWKGTESFWIASGEAHTQSQSLYFLQCSADMQNQICGLPHAGGLTMADKGSPGPSGHPQSQERPVRVPQQRLLPAPACMRLRAHCRCGGTGWPAAAELPWHGTGLRHRAAAWSYVTVQWVPATPARTASPPHPAPGLRAAGSSAAERVSAGRQLQSPAPRADGGRPPHRASCSSDHGYGPGPQQRHWDSSVLLIPAWRPRCQPRSRGWMWHRAAPATVGTADPLGKLWPGAQAGVLPLPFINDSALSSVREPWAFFNQHKMPFFCALPAAGVSAVWALTGMDVLTNFHPRLVVNTTQTCLLGLLMGCKM